MKRNTNIYLPLVPRGSFIQSGSQKNLLKNLAPVYEVHYENADPEEKVENVDPEKAVEKKAVENSGNRLCLLNNLENKENYYGNILCLLM